MLLLLLLTSKTSRALRCGLLGCCLSLLLSLASAADSVRCRMADGFDFPVGKPDADGYYKFRGFYPNGHLGEDWNGKGGGDSDLGDPIYATANGVVVYSANRGVGWGNCIILRHAFREADGKVQMVDSLYGHLNERKAKLYQVVERGQLIGTMGSNFGMYAVHLHFEIHKNLTMGMSRTNFAHDYSNYYSPTQFINARRTLDSSVGKVELPVNTFVPEGQDPGTPDTPSSKSGRGLSIPVFRGPSTRPAPTAPKGSTKVDPVARIQQDTQARNVAAGTNSSSGGDFWSRIKAKVSSGQLIDSNPLKR
jgi:Peptidase family M23